MCPGIWGSWVAIPVLWVGGRMIRGYAGRVLEIDQEESRAVSESFVVDPSPTVSHAIETRRSVRAYRPDPVPESVVRRHHTELQHALEQLPAEGYVAVYRLREDEMAWD